MNKPVEAPVVPSQNEQMGHEMSTGENEMGMESVMSQVGYVSDHALARVLDKTRHSSR